MSHLPPSADAAIKKRFATLIEEGKELLARMEAESRSEFGIEQFIVFPGPFESYRTKVLNLMGYLGNGAHMNNLADEIRKWPSYAGQMDRLLGVVRGLADDYEHGFLDSILRRAEAEVAADYLGQAERLLGEGQPGKYDHVPAAVLFGAVLEKALRTLGARQSPPVDLVDAKGKPKMLNGLIDELKKVGVFNELKAKQLRSWADIRNAAAHGEFDKFTRSDVEMMGAGVQTFLADNL